MTLVLAPFDKLRANGGVRPALLSMSADLDAREA